MKKKLRALLPYGTFFGDPEIEISGITADSRLVQPGDLFIAKKGGTFDGSAFVADAVRSGAIAILADQPTSFAPKIPHLIVSDLLAATGETASSFYDYPSRELLMIGITGTNGKTTSSYLVKHLLTHFGIATGLLGTIAQIIGPNSRPSPLTTCDAITNQRLFREMRNHGCAACVMEVSSHALVQGRVEGIQFDTALFTNLSQDHLDYHSSMEEYGRAKGLLFTSLKQRPIVNGDAPYLHLILEKCPQEPLRYSLQGRGEICAEEITLSPKGSSFTLLFPGGKKRVQIPLIGRFNIENCLAVLSLGYLLGFSIEEMIEALATFPHVRGRLERVDGEIDLYVDYAHTPDALTATLKALRELSSGKIWTVFGCGGDRDKGKRALMGKAVFEGSDEWIVTSDNPRSEDPQKIAEAILEGIPFPDRGRVLLDRKEAIYAAIESARPGDLILIAGKGHETYQIFANETISFDDREVAKEALHSKAKL